MYSEFTCLFFFTIGGTKQLCPPHQQCAWNENIHWEHKKKNSESIKSKCSPQCRLNIQHKWFLFYTLGSWWGNLISFFFFRKLFVWSRKYSGNILRCVTHTSSLKEASLSNQMSGIRWLKCVVLHIQCDKASFLVHTWHDTQKQYIWFERWEEKTSLILKS